MSKYALIDGTNTVQAVIMADAQTIKDSGKLLAAVHGTSRATWVKIPDGKIAGIGWAYNPPPLGTFEFPNLGFSRSATGPAIACKLGDSLHLDFGSDLTTEISLDKSTTADTVAASIQGKVRALAAGRQAMAAFTAAFDVESGTYLLKTGMPGPTAFVHVTGGSAAAALKLGTANGGTEAPGKGGTQRVNNPQKNHRTQTSDIQG